MVDEKLVKDGLREKLDGIGRELVEAQAEYSRLQRLIPELERRRDALKLVISSEFESDEIEDFFNDADTLEKSEPSPEVSQNSSKNGQTNGFRPPITRQRKGLKQTAREHFKELPQSYTKHDVVKILLRENKKMKAVNENTLSGIMRHLVETGLAEIKTHSAGKTAQIYEKV